MKLFTCIFILTFFACKSIKVKKYLEQEEFLVSYETSINVDYYFLSRIDSNLHSKELFQNKLTKEFFGELLLDELYDNEFFRLSRIKSHVPKNEYYYEPYFNNISHINKTTSDRTLNTKLEHRNEDRKLHSDHQVIGSNIGLASNRSIVKNFEDCFTENFEYNIIPVNPAYHNYLIEFNFYPQNYSSNLKLKCVCDSIFYEAGRLRLVSSRDGINYQSKKSIFIEILPFEIYNNSTQNIFRRWDKNFEICKDPQPHVAIRHLSPELNRFYPTLKAFYHNIIQHLSIDRIELWEKYVEIILQPYLDNMENVSFFKQQGNNIEFTLRFYEEEKTYPLIVNINKPYIVKFLNELPHKYSVFAGVDKKFTKPKYNYGLDLSLKQELDLSPMLTYKTNN